VLSTTPGQKPDVHFAANSCRASNCEIQASAVTTTTGASVRRSAIEYVPPMPPSCTCSGAPTDSGKTTAMLQCRAALEAQGVASAC